jgi:pSer/pThr/pTyr-binding forkhead associated (FHA) protein
MLIQDLNSTNGTFVNGKKIKKPFRLKENDEVVLGDKKFTFLRRESRGIKNGSNL